VQKSSIDWQDAVQVFPHSLNTLLAGQTTAVTAKKQSELEHGGLYAENVNAITTEVK